MEITNRKRRQYLYQNGQKHNLNGFTDPKAIWMLEESNSINGGPDHWHGEARRQEPGVPDDAEALD